jgi:hypothetical protein
MNRDAAKMPKQLMQYKSATLRFALGKLRRLLLKSEQNLEGSVATEV